jgi:hypothetical protein
MICEIINPSDAYTLEADDFDVACVAVAILGNGAYGLEADDGRKSPVFFGWDDWFAARGIVELGPYVEAHREEIARVLGSVMIGDRRQRADADAMLAMLPEGRRAEWLAGRHDRHRSSMNDIGSKAARVAERMRRTTSEQSHA